MCWVLGWMRGFLLPLAQDSCGHIHDGEADLWEEAGTASAQKMAGEIHPGKEQVVKHSGKGTLCSRVGVGCVPAQ